MRPETATEPCDGCLYYEGVGGCSQYSFYIISAARSACRGPYTINYTYADDQRYLQRQIDATLKMMAQK